MTVTENVQRARIENYDTTIKELREQYFQCEPEFEDHKQELLDRIEEAQREQLKIVRLGL